MHDCFFNYRVSSHEVPPLTDQWLYNFKFAIFKVARYFVFIKSI